MTDSARYQQVLSTLTQVGQEHLLHFYDQLDPAAQTQLLDQLEQQDWPQLAELIESHVKQSPEIGLPESIEPAPYYPAAAPEQLTKKYDLAVKHGEELLRAGKVAAFVVAGGQGTRLGWDGPKGTYPATPIQRKPLFQVFAETIIKAQRKYGSIIPWYIMTSPINDEPTRAFFKEHNYFGLNPKDVMFFQQGTIPSFSTEGKALLASPGQMATNPDGHGGSLRALHVSGAIADMEQRGIEQISYFQVDNPLINITDPLFIGMHAIDGAQMSSKMVVKVAPDEKVGNFTLSDGRIMVIEYSDLPKELEQKLDADGKPMFIAGSIAIHIIGVNFVKQLNSGRFALPYHRAIKKVPHVDLATGELVEPTEPNAVKLETFVFDALPLCQMSIVLETIRENEFGPIKNAEGVDSAVTSRQLQSQRAARWLRTTGVEVADDAVIELSPLTAIAPEDLQQAEGLPQRIDPGQRTVL
ncbi:UDPGP type 1 family protein [Planctomycetales bacterium ZRK34]|nr:UDPGP type 1 family protein [Planctomycetales bacterium ZRK34]